MPPRQDLNQGPRGGRWAKIQPDHITIQTDCTMSTDISNETKKIHILLKTSRVCCPKHQGHTGSFQSHTLPQKRFTTNCTRKLTIFYSFFLKSTTCKAANNTYKKKKFNASSWTVGLYYFFCVLSGVTLHVQCTLKNIILHYVFSTQSLN